VDGEMLVHVRQQRQRTVRDLSPERRTNESRRARIGGLDECARAREEAEARVSKRAVSHMKTRGAEDKSVENKGGERGKAGVRPKSTVMLVLFGHRGFPTCKITDP
jgi:hypothetical protein